MRKYSVAFETTIVEIWEVEANNQNEATMLATEARGRYKDEITNEENPSYMDAPTHSHIAKMKLLPVKPTVQ